MVMSRKHHKEKMPSAEIVEHIKESEEYTKETAEIVDWRGQLFTSIMNRVVQTYTLGRLNREEAQQLVAERLSNQSENTQHFWGKADAVPFLRTAKRAWEGTLGVDFIKGEKMNTHEAMMHYGSALWLTTKDTIGALYPGVTVAEAVTTGVNQMAGRVQEKDPESPNAKIMEACAKFVSLNADAMEKKFDGVFSENKETANQNPHAQAA